MPKENLTFDTLAAQAGSHADPNGAVAFPLYLSSNYRHPSLQAARNFDATTGYTYSRLATPNRRVLEKTLAQLEAGTHAFALSSGMAAIQLALSILKTGEEVISLDDLYGGDFRYFRYLESHAGIHFKQWNGEKVADLIAQITAKTRLIWLETPSNPTMKQLDIQTIANQVHAKNPQVLVAVDNTFLTPVYQRPLTLGADIVVHSATKYLSGHNDLLGGVLVCKDDELAKEYYDYYLTTGDTMSTFDSWLLLRSLKTLSVRMQRHTSNAQAVVEYLKQAPQVTKVLYPGKGGMVSFYLQSEAQVEHLLNHVKVISFAESLGGVESLITIPYYQTHADVAENQRARLGITPQLLRLSVGLEDPQDLIADLEQALSEK
ncbi:PLP-dependent aspartate aminotransferase family protein [Lactobacillus sp. 3B(2020)]|uniref:trans-sulfuration enzyme family protein n=1 Tax=Lactobacillus sp. 3B(2020) TaxID=2695882 RepID=UPI0015DDC77C|nr:PLP-dependent aspartate aminotransferase family protein [Lactobacillus sp. 3B(2020)]QLL70819.1 methionine biosynthesis PLP-dependent protein [Lactobacillus sp. 3B(2020)]